ncbi:MAG: ADP-ribosylation factor-like protein [Candidatus Hodarchaeota archaeon]
MDGEDSESDNLIVQAIIFSIFHEEGPVPFVALINESDGIRVYKKDAMKDVSLLSYGALLQISMKSISLLMGEHTYQDGDTPDKVKYFGILPFPDLKMDALTYFFLIPDEDARGSARASTITILVNERNKNFFYDYMNQLRILITEHANKIDRMFSYDEFSNIMVDLLKKLNNFGEQISYPIPLKRNVKILFSGLDNSGKTSMILGLEKKYSKLINVSPTQGIARHQSHILGLTIAVWDLAGQIKYRDSYLTDAELYLYDCDLLFYLIDITDTNRLDESVAYFEQILNALRNFEEYPPIVVNLHKVDPDKKEDPNIKNNINQVKKRIELFSDDFSINFFETTIFEPFSLLASFSYGLVALNPNREIFTYQLENFAKSLNASSILLLNEQGLIISDFSSDEISKKIFELSAPHFTSVYNNFTQFMSQDSTKAFYTLENKIVTFHVIKLHHNKLYLMIFFSDKDKDSLDKIDENLGELEKKLEDLFKTFV